MAPVIQGAQDGNAVLQSGYVCLCAGQNMCMCAEVFVRLGLDVCIHMVWWQHVWILLAPCQMCVIGVCVCVSHCLYSESFQTFKKICLNCGTFVQIGLFRSCDLCVGRITMFSMYQIAVIGGVLISYPMTKCQVKMVPVHAGFFALPLVERQPKKQTPISPSWLPVILLLILPVLPLQTDPVTWIVGKAPHLSSASFLLCTVILTPKTAPQRTSVSLRIERAVSSPFSPLW